MLLWWVWNCILISQCSHAQYYLSAHTHTHTPMHVHAHKMYNFIHTHPPTLHRFITLQFCGSTGWTAPQRPTTAASAEREVDCLPAAGCRSPHDYHTHHWQIQKNKVYITLLHIWSLIKQHIGYEQFSSSPESMRVLHAWSLSSIWKVMGSGRGN